MQKAREGWARSPSHTKYGRGRDRSQAERGCQGLLYLALLTISYLTAPLLSIITPLPVSASWVNSP